MIGVFAIQRISPSCSLISFPTNYLIDYDDSYLSFVDAWRNGV